MRSFATECPELIGVAPLRGSCTLWGSHHRTVFPAAYARPAFWQPYYARSAIEDELAGDTTVVMTVQADGSVANIHLIGSSLRSMDKVALNTLKTWKFKPAMCGTDPIVSDLQVVVRFRAR